MSHKFGQCNLTSCRSIPAKAPVQYPSACSLSLDRHVAVGLGLEFGNKIQEFLANFCLMKGQGEGLDVMGKADWAMDVDFLVSF